MQPGKSTPAVVQTFNVKIVITQFRHPSMNVRADSDEGASHDFRRVGRAAAWSAQTKDTSAIVGSFTKAQKMSPATEIEPHTMSKVPIFHTACELRKDAATTAKGTSPSMQRHPRSEAHVFLNFHAEGEHALKTPERPRHSVRRRLSAQGVADVNPSPEPRQHNGEIDKTRVNHPSSLPVLLAGQDTESGGSGSLRRRGHARVLRYATSRRHNLAISRHGPAHHARKVPLWRMRTRRRASSPSKTRADDPRSTPPRTISPSRLLSRRSR